MEFKAAIRQILQSRHDTYVEMIMAGTSEPQPPGQAPTTPEDVMQMVNGFFVIVNEGLEGGSETRRFFVETVFPGLRDAGSTADFMIAGCARAIIIIACDVTQQISSEHREAAQQWLATFFGMYLGEIAQIWSAR
jgi:hypothetical protein